MWLVPHTTKVVEKPRKTNSKNPVKPTRPMKKQTFYAVATTIFDDGRTIVRLAGTAEDYVKPTNKCHSTARADRYVDWFESKAEAEEFVANNTL